MEIGPIKSDRLSHFHPPELADAQPHEKGGDADAEPQTRQIEPALAAEQAPA